MVIFNYLTNKGRPKEVRRLKRFIPVLFKKEKKKLSLVTYIFCTDEYLLEINREYLSHDYYTDIITFGLSADGEPVLADIYISTDRVKENAIHYGVSYQEELKRVMFHGALHLCGYKDKSKAEIQLMRSKESSYLSKYNSFFHVEH